MDKLPRIMTLNDRILNSGVFPRIRDAENEMKLNEKAFLKKLDTKKFQEKKKKEREKEKLKINPSIQVIKKVVPKKIIAEEYFTAFVLNKDPKAAQYMPFDTVYFPKLFHENTKNVPPESIDGLWMIGFQDLALREKR